MADRTDASPPTISVDEHRSRILATVSALAPITVPLADALGRTLIDDVLALVDVPNFDNSAMDGYAIRHADVAAATASSPATSPADASTTTEHPVILTVVADLPAGSAENPALKAGQAARIMTGAPVPDDADCIVPVEDTDAGTDTVSVFRIPAFAAHIRHTGTDVRTHDAVLTAGRTLNARDLSAAAATGSCTVKVVPAPRVGVLSTGSELRAPGDPLGRGEIHDSNSLLIAASVAECGGIPILIGSVPDDADALRSAFETYAPQVDAFVTSGGVSVGAYDVVKAVLAPLGVWFGPVRMQPGKPQGFGEWPGTAGGTGTPIFALPGNPVSVFVSFEQFVRPALLAMQGRQKVLRPVLHAVAITGWKSPTGRAQYMPAFVEQISDGSFSVRPASAGGSGSYLVASLACANALAMVPESVTEVHEGDLVDVTLVP